jgi:hypothetical protein
VQRGAQQVQHALQAGSRHYRQSAAQQNTAPSSTCILQGPKCAPGGWQQPRRVWLSLPLPLTNLFRTCLGQCCCNRASKGIPSAFKINSTVGSGKNSVDWQKRRRPPQKLPRQNNMTCRSTSMKTCLRALCCRWPLPPPESSAERHTAGKQQGRRTAGQQGGTSKWQAFRSHQRVYLRHLEQT